MIINAANKFNSQLPSRAESYLHLHLHRELIKLKDKLQDIENCGLINDDTISPAKTDLLMSY